MSKEEGPNKGEEKKPEVTFFTEWKAENVSDDDIVNRLGKLQTALSDTFETESLVQKDLDLVEGLAKKISELTDGELREKFFTANNEGFKKDSVYFALVLIEGVRRGLFKDNDIYRSYADSYASMLPGVDVIVDDSVEALEPLSVDEVIDLKNYFYDLKEELDDFNFLDWKRLEIQIKSDIKPKWMLNNLRDLDFGMGDSDYVTKLAYTYKCVRAGLLEDEDGSDFFQELVNLVNRGVRSTKKPKKEKEETGKILKFKKEDLKKGDVEGE